MNMYTDLVAARDELRRAKDHEQTMRAIAEAGEMIGKTADDRKRELAFTLSQHDGWRMALADVRDCELAVDRAQARIDQAEAERREKEWKIRARLADVLGHIEETNIADMPMDNQIKQRIISRVQSRLEMDELFET